MGDDRMRIAEFEGLLDRHGADLSTWPDGQAAKRARELLLADPAARPALEAARGLDAMLGARAKGFKADGPMADRVAGAVLPALEPPTGETRRWVMRLAASFLIAAVVGGAFDRMVLQPAPAEDMELAMLESFVFGPDEVEIR